MNVTLTDKNGNKQYFTDIAQISTTHVTKEDFIYDMNAMGDHSSALSKEMEGIVKKLINCSINSCIVDSSLTVYKLFIKNNKVYIHPSDLSHCRKFEDLDLTFQNRIVYALYNQLSW